MGKIRELVPAEAGVESFSDRRRRSQRFPLHEDLELETGVSVKGITLDLSKDGIRAALESMVMIGEQCPLVVRTSGTDTYRQDARVVWTRPVGEHYIAGFQFI